MRRIVPVIALLALAIPSASTAAPPVQVFGRTVKPLLYVTAAESGDDGIHWSKSEIYIFRDGTVVSASLGQMFNLNHVQGASFYTGVTSPERLRELGMALTNARVGFQEDCEIDPPDSPLEWYFGFHWFGVGERQNSFAATQYSGPPCPPEIEQLIFAVGAVRGSAFQAAKTKLAIPCAPCTTP